MDAFYASVEQFENPGLRGKPVIVGGVDSARGVVSSASYEARAFGIHSAMPVTQARKRCPHGIYIPGRHAVYGEYSGRIMDLLSEFSPVIEQVSVDEAFLDMTGTEGLFGDAEESGRRVKAAIRKRIGLTASVGAAENKFLAKLASDARKPDGKMVVLPGGAREFLDPMPVGRLWGVGKKTVAELQQLGLYTIAQLRLHPLPSLSAHLGEDFARHLHELAHGSDRRELEAAREEKSISHECTFETDRSDREALSATLLALSERVARRARKEGLAGSTVTFVWRNPDFSRQSHARSLAEPTHSSPVIYHTALGLFGEVAGGTDRKFRLIGLRLSNFSRETAQLSLFQEAKPNPKLDQAMDAVRDRFGDESIRRARLGRREFPWEE